MAKRVEIDGKFYRKRRGKLVEIPEEWVGRTWERGWKPSHNHTPPSELPRKARRFDKYRNGYGRQDNDTRFQHKDALGNSIKGGDRTMAPDLGSRRGNEQAEIDTYEDTSLLEAEFERLLDDLEDDEA